MTDTPKPSEGRPCECNSCREYGRVLYECQTHGQWNARHASGCPECVREMRAELAAERERCAKLEAENARLRRFAGVDPGRREYD